MAMLTACKNIKEKQYCLHTLNEIYSGIVWFPAWFSRFITVAEYSLYISVL